MKAVACRHGSCSIETRASKNLRYIIVHHELPDLRRIVGPGAMEIASVVPVPRHPGRIDDRPSVRSRNSRSGSSSRSSGLMRDAVSPRPWGSVPVRSRSWMASPPPSEVQPPLCTSLPPTSKFLLDHEHRCPEVACPHRGVQPDTARPEHHDIGLIIPANVARAERGFLCLARH